MLLLVSIKHKEGNKEAGDRVSSWVPSCGCITFKRATKHSNTYVLSEVVPFQREQGQQRGWPKKN